jgi:hypothetical protein
MQSHIFNVFAFFLGLGMALLNKEMAEGTRQFNLAVVGRDYGTAGSRVAYIVGGIIFVALSVLTW